MSAFSCFHNMDLEIFVILAFNAHGLKSKLGGRLGSHFNTLCHSSKDIVKEK